MPLAGQCSEAERARLLKLTEARSARTRLQIGAVAHGKTVLDYIKRDGRLDVMVRCHCGVVKAMQQGQFRRNRSCGCKAAEYQSISKTVHGEKSTPTWNSWSSMLARCYRSSHKSYHDYGGRGITVCERWHEYVNFRDDMGRRPPGTQLDRIDNSGNYQPGNCRWATSKQNNNNRRSSRLITWRGEARTLTEWTEVLGIDRGTVWKRLFAGWDIDRAFTEPPKRQRNNTAFNRTRGASGYTKREAV